MRSNLLVLFAFTSILSFAQPNTEVFLFDLNTDKGSFQLSNYKNISDNKGYDNQPSFIDNETILYAGTRNDQTDIVQYDTNYGSKTWLCYTEDGEYSPLKIPKQNAVSAIRLDPDGKQRLYRYNLKNSSNTILLDTLVVGYHIWYDENTVISSVLESDYLSLYVSDIKSHQNKKLAEKVGRSLHHIPNSKLISFISKNSNGSFEIKSLNPITGDIKTIAPTLPNVEDMCWLLDGNILMATDDKLFELSLKSKSDWTEVASLKSYGISKISRLATSPDGKKLAIVGELSAKTSTNNSINNPALMTETQVAAIVQAHIEPYNNGSIDFLNSFDDNVIVNVFPDQKQYEGRQQMKENYERVFKNNTNLSVHVNNRMVLGTTVIDEELLTANKTNNRQATIYQTGDDTIKSMTFIANSEVSISPEFIVNKQLEAYNSRNIEAFVATYSKDVKICNFPNTLTIEGNDNLKEKYAPYFDNTPNLNATIINRIIIGNKVIDKEKVTANDKTFYAIAIYEVEHDKIVKVTFIR